jgi:hypothetical protein
MPALMKLGCRLGCHTFLAHFQCGTAYQHAEFWFLYCLPTKLGKVMITKLVAE